MKIIYSKQSKEQLFGIKAFISQDNKKAAVEYLAKLKSKIEILSEYPYIGAVNATANAHHIRDYVALGYKVIYKINVETIIVLAIYKYVDFDEKQMLTQKEVWS
jgi:plasmid stabilization system protein ParE